MKEDVNSQNEKKTKKKKKRKLTEEIGKSRELYVCLLVCMCVLTFTTFWANSADDK